MGESDDSDSSSSSNGSNATVTSTATIASTASTSSSRPSRDRKRRRNDDSLAEELERKCQNAKKAKTASKESSKKGHNSIKKKKSSKEPKEHGVKPNPQSKLKRSLAIKEATRLNALKAQPINLNQPGPGAKKDTEVKHVVRSPSNIHKTDHKEKINNLCDNDKEFTPQKKKMKEEIERLRKQLEESQKGSGSEFDGDLLLDTTLTAKPQEQEGNADESIYSNNTLVEDRESDLKMQSGPNSPGEFGCGSGEDDLKDPPSEKKQKKGKSKKTKRKKKISKNKSKKGKKGKKDKKRRKRKYSSSSSSSSSTSSSSSSSSTSSSEKKTNEKELLKKRRKLINYNLLQHKVASEEVEEIVKGSGIFMNAVALAKAMGPAARSHTSAARLLCRGVFTDARKKYRCYHSLRIG